MSVTVLRRVPLHAPLVPARECPASQRRIGDVPAYAHQMLVYRTRQETDRQVERAVRPLHPFWVQALGLDSGGTTSRRAKQEGGSMMFCAVGDWRTGGRIDMHDYGHH